jgi:dTDP-4-dehydrorhamnose 3,5-epimerase
MLFTPTHLPGVTLLDLDPHHDARGFFARAWCQREMQQHKLLASIVQVNISFNACKGTLRGIHYQLVPHQEAKVVSCYRGGLFDVVVDLREGSPTFRQWVSVELTAENRRRLYIPPGCAHGFQTLADDTEVLYLMSEFYSPEHARGIRYDDPALAIPWPLPLSCISDADLRWPRLGE